jgi:8-oxo-dGTP diphosphatase
MPAEYDLVLCFLTRGEQVLMLHRAKAPNLGLWNGLGGHIEPGETPHAACLREVFEESGYHINLAHFAGLLTWSGFETGSGGLYIFIAEAPPGEAISSSEGELVWMPQEWLFNAPEVVENIHFFAPHVLNGSPPLVYHFDYHGSSILHYEVRPLPAWLKESDYITCTKDDTY